MGPTEAKDIHSHSKGETQETSKNEKKDCGIHCFMTEEIWACL